MNRKGNGWILLILVFCITFAPSFYGNRIMAANRAECAWEITPEAADGVPTIWPTYNRCN